LSHVTNAVADEEDNYYQGLIFKGVRLLHTMLFGIKDHEHLVSLMQENLTFGRHWLDDYGPMDESVQKRRYMARCPLGEKMDAQTPMPFQGDGRSDTPPFGWTFLWREMYCSLFGDYIPKGLRASGYVFWDAERLRSMGGLEFLERQMKGWEDPRNYHEDDYTPFSWARRPADF
jgi:hypothetical protein